MTIGPHVGKELELMLAREKKLAAFGDFIPESGEISEEIIPENAFAPYVSSGRFIRIEKLSPRGEDKWVHKAVCFTLPGEEWRAHFFLWYHEALSTKEHRYSPTDEYIIGHLLGYKDEDIAEFVTRMTKD